MAKVLTEDQNYYDIADAIRGKLDVETLYLPSEMAAAIETIETGIELTSEDEGKVVVEDAGSYVLAEQTSLSVSQNGTYDTTTNDEVLVEVSGSSVLVSKTIIQNGTYDPADDQADGYSSVTVNVQGGQSGDIEEEWDLTESSVGQHYNVPLTLRSISMGESGATFNSASDVITIPLFYSGSTIEVDVSMMQLTSGTHRRFIMPTQNSGLIYRSTGVWAFYGGSSWVESGETDGSFFDGSTVTVNIDSNRYWHIYKNDVLWWEPQLSLGANANGTIMLGSTDGNSINNAIISGIRVLIPAV